VVRLSGNGGLDGGGEDARDPSDYRAGLRGQLPPRTSMSSSIRSQRVYDILQGLGDQAATRRRAGRCDKHKLHPGDLYGDRRPILSRSFRSPRLHTDLCFAVPTIPAEAAGMVATPSRPNLISRRKKSPSRSTTAAPADRGWGGLGGGEVG